MRTCILTFFALLLIATVSAGCNDSVGDFCRQNVDCDSEAFCCKEGKCGGGMCTLECRSDRDCPSDMVCRDKKYCLFSCNSDRDCFDGWQCKEKDGRTMCVGD